MDQAIKKKWIKYLTSGKYRRTGGALKTSESGKTKHCCLGVLCEIYHEEQPSAWEGGGLDDGAYRFVTGKEENDARSGILPLKVAKWAGLNERTSGEFIDKDGNYPEETDLVILNDSGKSFSYIAKKIQKYF